MFEFAQWLLSYVIPFLAVLMVIVFVHEMGHYLAARWSGVAIHTFSIGFGRELFGFTDRLGTRWRISSIPLGGYVRFVGDMNAASVPDRLAIEALPPSVRDRLFINQSVWKRIGIVAAGPVANIIFTFLVLYALLLSYGQYVVDPVLDEVQVGSVAESAGLMSGDRIVSVDGYPVHSFSDFQRLVNTSPEREIVLNYERGGEEASIVLVPQATTFTDRFGNDHRIGQIGVAKQISSEDIVLFRPSAVEAVGITAREMVFILDRTADFIGDFFVGRGDIEQLGGPVKIAQVSGEIATLGIIALINLAALLSLNIGVFNLLPIPLLDGGHLLYYAYEAVMGRPLSPGMQEAGFRVGIALIGTLMIFTLINDIFL